MQLALLPLALEQRGVDERVALVVVHLLDDDRERLVRGRPVDADDVGLLAHARRPRHVVDRLGALERVHRDGAVLLEQHDAIARGEAGREAAGVADRAAADENAHGRDGTPPSPAASDWRGGVYRADVFEIQHFSNGTRLLTAPQAEAQSTCVMVMYAVGSRYEDDATGGISHFAEHLFFKGTERRPTAREIATRDRRHRRRVQRLHGQGVHRLLRQVREGARARRDRRARRHAAALALRRRGDRAREGRDRRGDEHVPRHADELPARASTTASATATRRSAATSSARRRRSARPRARRSCATSAAGTCRRAR